MHRKGSRRPGVAIVNSTSSGNPLYARFNTKHPAPPSGVFCFWRSAFARNDRPAPGSVSVLRLEADIRRNPARSSASDPKRTLTAMRDPRPLTARSWHPKNHYAIWVRLLTHPLSNTAETRFRVGSLHTRFSKVRRRPVKNDIRR
jgi:hypothetical protein